MKTVAQRLAADRNKHCWCDFRGYRRRWL